MQNMTNTNTGSFTVAETGLLYVGGTLTNNGTMTFNNDASLLRGSTGVDGGSGTYLVRRQGSTGNLYNLWSSPVAANGSVPGNPSWSYTEANSTQWNGDDQPQDPGWNSYNGTMNIGEGYAGRGAGLASFSDNEVNNGNESISLWQATYDPTFTSTTGGTPFNLVGNPYPSGLDAAELINDNPNIFGSLYFWVDDGSGGTDYTSADYAVWNLAGGLPYTNAPANGSITPNGIVKTGQAFMLRNQNAGTLQFNNSQRVANTASNGFFRQNGNDSRLWFSINGQTQSYFNQIWCCIRRCNHF